jgi:hypothetical protein
VPGLVLAPLTPVQLRGLASICGVVLVLLIGAGCKKTARPALEGLEVVAPERTVLESLGLRTDDVRDRLRAALTRKEAFAATPSAKNEKGWRAAFEFDLLETAEPARVLVRGTLALKRPDDGRYDLDCGVDQTLHYADVDGRREALRQALDGVLASCADQAAEQVKVQGKGLTELVALVDAGTPAVQAAALRVLVEQHRPEAVPGLIARLDSDEPMVVRRAIGSLVELKETRAAGALIDALKAKDTQFQREIVFALAAIGGDEAEAFLYTVAQGHEDPGLRSAAQAGLDEMGEPRRRRRDGG